MSDNANGELFIAGVELMVIKPCRHRLFFGALFVALTGLAGCADNTSIGPPTVKGHVFYRGAPLSGGLIVFVPDEDRGSGGPMCKGSIELNGSFSLPADIAAGWYRVAIAPLPTMASGLPTIDVPYPNLPARYRNPRLSGLLSEVKVGTENVFDFWLDDAPLPIAEN